MCEEGCFKMEMFFTGKTVEEATEAALTKLGIAREEVSIEVVEMPVRKLFRSIPAKIRVSLLAEEQEVEKKAEKKNADKKVEKKTQPEKKPVAEKPAVEKTQTKAEVESEEAKEPVEKKQQAFLSAEEKKSAEPIDPAKIALAKSYLETVAADMGVTDFTVTPEQQEETLVLKVEGGDLGILIGRHGDTMEALSHLTGLAVNRLGGDYQKVALDVAGYRSKREGDLAALAKRVGAKVAKTGRSYTMEPMNPYERRIIHTVIGRMEGVTSQSIGEGDDRRVVVSCSDPSAIKPGEANRHRNNRGGNRNGGNRQGGNRQGGNRNCGNRNGGNRQGGNRNGGNRGNGRYNGGEARTEYKERSREQFAAPVAGNRSETVNDAPSVSLYGKIEL